MTKNKQHNKVANRPGHNPADTVTPAKANLKAQKKMSGKKTEKSLRRFVNVASVSILAFSIFAFFMMAIRNGYMMRWYDEMSLFEPTKFFFREFINYPGGILRYAGAWLTQFMYYPALGSIVLIALWLLMAWITCRAFHFTKFGVPFSLIIPLAMLVSIMQLDEAWLTLKTPGYIYSNTLGYLFSIAMIWLFRMSEKRRILSLFVPALITLTYSMAGFYSLLASAVCLVILLIEAFMEKDYRMYLAIALTLAIIILTPKLYYIYWHGNTVDNDYLLLKGLPELLFESFDIYLWLPFVVASNWLIVMGIIGNIHTTEVSRLTPWFSVGLMCLSILWVVRADHKSEQLRATVLMMRFIEQHNWEGISDMMGKLKEEPNHTMLMINNLANASQGYKTEKLPKFSPKPADGRHNESFTMSVFVNVPVDYYVGQNNLSYRWAMEHTVQYGKRVFFLKYMVKNALVNGETAVAKRYNDILKRTMFHRNWANEMDKYIENPSLIDRNEEFKAVKSFKNNNKKT